MTRLNKAVARVTREPFFTYGPHRERPFVATLAPGDVLELRPLRCRSEGSAVSIRLADVYRYALQCRVNSVRLEHAREVKKKKAEARARRKFLREIRKENAS